MADHPPIGLPRVVLIDVLDLPQGRKPTAGEVQRALNAMQDRLVKQAEHDAARALRRAEARQRAENNGPKKPDQTNAAQAASQDEPEKTDDVDV